MMIKYRDVVLAKNSQAYDLWQRKDFKKLDQHLKELDHKNAELLRRYEPKPTKENTA